MPDNKYADFEASTNLEQKQYKDIYVTCTEIKIYVYLKKKKKIQKNIQDFSTKFMVIQCVYR